ncbi:MAG TPA: FAD-dependent monooxygenase, partial [Burkholderiales bacterium]|nr:FAD-dependent monooxygenase [Burkholderiales bacterium]
MPQEEYKTDVLICGAGASGLALGIELARRNIAFALIDKAPEPFRGSRGKGLQPRSLEVFEDMGVIDRICALATLHTPVRNYRGTGYTDEPALPDASNPAEPYGAPLMLPQFLTEAVLRERLAELGHHVQFGHELLAFTQDEEGVTARIATPQGEEQLRARYLAGTDGGRSLVRHVLNIDFPGETLNVRAIAADVEADGVARDAWHRWGVTRETALWLCPLPGTGLFQLQAPIGMQEEPDLTAAGLNAMVAARTGRTDIHVRSVNWASAYGMSARLAGRYRQGRVFLVGDAAHIHPPTGGQGLNTSLQDSYNLGWKFAAVLHG